MKIIVVGGTGTIGKTVVNELSSRHEVIIVGNQRGDIQTDITSISSINGSEFARHKEISLELNAEFFFAHPYSSWERGLNENTNGLVRQYLKKGSEFNAVTDHDLAIIASKLNSRPRKTLGYKSPNEVFNM